MNSNKAELTKRSLMLKTRIVSTLSSAMLRSNLDFQNVASQLKMSQQRVKTLLDLTNTSLDLFDLMAVAELLKVRIRVKSKRTGTNPEAFTKPSLVSRVSDVTGVA